MGLTGGWRWLVGSCRAFLPLEKLGSKIEFCSWMFLVSVDRSSDLSRMVCRTLDHVVGFRSWYAMLCLLFCFPLAA
jgi:hypothetical protein